MRKSWSVLAFVLVLCAGSWLGVAQSGAGVEVDGAALVSAGAALTDAHVGNLFFMLGVLASTADVQVGVWSGMQELLAQFELLPISFNVWYLLPDGGYYKVATGLTGSNLSDRDYFPRVMAGEATIGDLVISKSTGRKSMVMTVPIERGGEVVGALGATVYLDDLSDLILGALDLPQDVVLFAHTPTGEITLCADADLLLANAGRIGFDSATDVTARSSFLNWTFVLAAASDET